MKILFDTNVLISAFITSGTSYDVIEDAVHEHEAYYTSFILDEFSDIFKNKFHYSEQLIKEFLEFIKIFFIRGETGFNKDNVCRDADDNQILADAVINGIDVIITGDKDLLDLKKYKGIKIICPGEYWKL